MRLASLITASLITALALMLISHGVVAQSLVVEEAQVRAVPPVSTTTVAFMVLRNEGETARSLVAASTPAARVAELHHHADVDGVMQMRRVEVVRVPAGEQVSLVPGGYHLMLIDLIAPLHEGDEVALSLTFDDGETLEVMAPVRRIETMKHGMADETGEMSHSAH